MSTWAGKTDFARGVYVKAVKSGEQFVPIWRKKFASWNDYCNSTRGGKLRGCLSKSYNAQHQKTLGGGSCR